MFPQEMYKRVSARNVRVVARKFCRTLVKNDRVYTKNMIVSVRSGRVLRRNV